jgi:hypothetical protein
LLCLLQFFSPRTNINLAQWVASLTLPAPLSAPVSVQFAATAILIAVFLSYVCFVIYIRSTGKESYRLKTELALAHSIQKTLVPVMSKKVSFMRSSVFLNPAKRLVAILSTLSNCRAETRLPTWRTSRATAYRPAS